MIINLLCLTVRQRKFYATNFYSTGKFNFILCKLTYSGEGPARSTSFLVLNINDCTFLPPVLLTWQAPGLDHLVRTSDFLRHRSQSSQHQFTELTLKLQCYIGEFKIYTVIFESFIFPI